MKRQSGFTMVELLITMAIFVITIVAASNVFLSVVTQFKQQSKITETQLEGLVGLDVLRRDIEQAGFGLPWIIPSDVNYNEGSTNTSGTIPSPNLYNDATNNPPRAFVSGDNIVGLKGSDYFVIKATSVGTSEAVMKWTEIVKTLTGYSVKLWNSPIEDLIDDDYAICIIPSRGLENQRILVTDGTNFTVKFKRAEFPPAFGPTTQNDTYLVYGIYGKTTEPTITSLRMPFNRTDYYIDRNTVLPPRCATGTGILTRTIISQKDGNRIEPMPILDCVADFQVIYLLDTDDDGDIDSYKSLLKDNEGNDLTARQIREQLKEVRVYILAHEGQKDISYKYPDSSVVVGEFGVGRTYNFIDEGINDWERYRWKVYRIGSQPNNLG